MAAQEKEVAIIGSGCRFPGNVTSSSKLWELLREPKIVASEVPALKGYYHTNGQYHGHANVKEAYLLEEKGAHRRFDAAFFTIKPIEARVLDPQSRLLLETVYEALEDSGHTIDDLRGSDTAVYAGQMVNDYELLMCRDPENLGAYHATGTSRTMLSNRVSYFFDWHGPSMTIDTACSSSLVALHQAVQQLRLGHSRVAIVAGSNLIYDAGTFIAETNLQMLSPEGRSRMWDAEANGYARGEGVAAIVLKTRANAEADGDTIECIIRETAIGQDGKTSGQTVPSALAQAQLIRDCYARAGLDLDHPFHRPQYFEAHGTGTPAGDPIEAEAISSAFFPNGCYSFESKSVSESQSQSESEPVPLFVGSIKTVIGHTEGTAGLAGILKASLALQHGTIPPNLLFNRLNPRIEPFYNNLRIPTSLTPWPKVVGGTPRRVSINSFGFGGTNAHAILESYAPPAQKKLAAPVSIFQPFVFSAASEASLKTYLKNFCDYLRRNEITHNLKDIAYSLDTRRTRFAVATAVGASTTDELYTKLEAKLEASQADSGQRVGVRATYEATHAERSRVLGLFTGQGAQWAQMGLDLINASSASRRIIEGLQSRLDQLPAADRPAWSLLQELRKDESSRIMEAVISQPLCTAVQIVQIDLLREAGVEFTAVVGHSSGEIAAAYAANLISAEDAICIAYYRGLCSRFAQGSDGQKGAMMAVETSANDAQDLLDFPDFEGRACVAAINSATSVTLSGNQDAIEELKIVFEDEVKFARILKVDKAYHSHHMEACSSKYLDSLAALDIQVNPGNRTVLFSSVYGSKIDQTDVLKGRYWDQNMVNPVLFMQAVRSACATVGSFDLVIEVGPHAVLKRPALQTIEDQISHTVPYTGLFRRGVPAITSFADGLGYAWIHLGKEAVDLQSYDQFISGKLRPRLVKGLPKYVWDHENEYWHESRFASAVRLRPGPVHELLGHLTPDSTEQDMRWRHNLRISEVEWLGGHRLQNIVVFPASGYVVSVLEAALMLCEDNSAKLIEILDMNIISALVFGNDDLSIEIILSLTNISRPDKETIEAEFKYHAASGMGTDALQLKANGRIRIQSGQTCHNILPARLPRRSNLVPIREGRFYESTWELGYHYTGQFRSLERLERKLGAATGFISFVEPSGLLIHPAVLDAIFQSTFLTYADPDDGAQKSMYVPRRIQRLTVNPDLCAREKDHQRALSFDATHPLEFPHSSMACDIDVYPVDIDYAMIQVERLECGPFSQQTEKDDREVFSNVVWGVAEPDAQIIASHGSTTSSQLELAPLLERAAAFYLRVLEREISINHPSRVEGPYKDLLKFASRIASLSSAGELPFLQPQWEQDSAEVLIAACEPFAGTIDMRVLSEIGENLVAIVKGSRSAPDVAIRVDLADEWCMNGFGIGTFTAYLARIVKQIVHRYPHMHILEARAEMGAATKAILHEISDRFASYTVLVPTSWSFDPAKAWLEMYKEKIMFRPSDISNDLLEQGLSEKSYDLVVVPLTLQTTPDLYQTLHNLRCLLKPGGQIIVLELSHSPGPFFGAIFGAFPNRRLSGEEGTLSSPVQWDRMLRNAGFSGIDTSTPDDDVGMPFSVFTSQAVDDKISFLRDPLSAALAPGILIQDLVIVGGSSFKTSGLTSQLSTILKPYCSSLRTACSLPDFLGFGISSNTVLLSLADLETSVFGKLDNEKWKALKKMLLHAGTLIWISQGRLGNNPYANMMLGLVRGAVRDNPTLNYLLFDIEDTRMINYRVIAETVLRHTAASRWREESMHLTVESEVVLDEAGRFLISRLIMNKEMNDRYNSNRRELRSRVQPNLHNIGVSTSGSGWDIELKPPTRRLDGENMSLQTTHLLHSPVRIAEFGCMFVALGTIDTSGDKVVALSSENNSLIHYRKELSIAVTVSPGSQARLLSLTANHLLASIVLRGLSKDDKVLAYEPSPEFASAIAEESRLLGVQVTFTTTNVKASRAQLPSWVVIHPAASQRAVAHLVQGGFSVFVDMTPHSKIESMGDRIALALPTHCRKDSLETLFGKTTWNPTAQHLDEIHGRLARAVAWASTVSSNLTGSKEQVLVAALDSFTEYRNRLQPITVIDLTTHSEVSVKVQPVDSQVSFPENKTYWLVGLTGGLGLSLCEWMVQRGARYFVITSRKPNIETAWLDEMRAKGVTVKISTCDITHRDQVVALHSEISSSMPAIAGVAQGVMVLQDTDIQDMTLEQLLTVTKPKVEGSIYLNDLFQENTLDFFVFFSSASSVVGNHGQANYSAANTFMASLAQQRRRRGLAASIIDIGPIIGVGYITRSTEGSIFGKVILQTGGFVRTSERDFHQLFAEAVLAGCPGSTAQIELVSGVRNIDQQEKHLPVWESWPRMSHLVLGYKEAEDPARSGSRANIPIKARIAEASNSEQVYDIIWDAFTGELSSHFQLEVGHVRKDELSAMRFDQMGIDSLTAVEIRGWFMKNLEVNVPVLKVLNGGTVGELVATATETVLIPNLDGTMSDGPADSYTGQEISVSNSESAQVDSSITIARSGPVILKSVPISFTQARFYPSGLFLEDRSGLNHTVWARVTGNIDPERLRKGIRALGQHHEILRTAFFDQDGVQMQHILESSLLQLEHQQIENEEEVTKLAMSIQKGYIYDLAGGETVRIILLSRSPTENFLLMGLHPLVMDATSFQTFVRWLAFHYTYPQTRRRVNQFADISEQRHTDYATGKLEAELQYWRKEFATPPNPLPLLTLAKVDDRPTLKAYENIRATCRIGADTKVQILKVCRLLRATPFLFYLAALRALLLRYTVGGEDVTIAVAESGRSHDIEEMDVIGPLYNLVLVRLLSYPSTRFEDLLGAARDKTYAGLANSKLPYPMLVKELDLQRTAKYFPFFQVFADYRMGQRETVTFGENNKLLMMGFDLNVPYDVYLDTIDEPDGECAHEFFLRKDLFGEVEAERLAQSYKRLIDAFAVHPGMTVDEVDL